MSTCLLASLALAALLSPIGSQAQSAAPVVKGESSAAGKLTPEPGSAIASPAAEALHGAGATTPAGELLPFTVILGVPTASAPRAEAEAAISGRAGCWAQATTDYNGGDLPSPAPVTGSAEGCCSACWDAPGCGAWTFRASDVSASGRGEVAA